MRSGFCIGAVSSTGLLGDYFISWPTIERPQAKLPRRTTWRPSSPNPFPEIRIDGRAFGSAPLTEPARVAAGTVVVELRAPGHFPATRTVVVVAEQLTRETLTLLPSTGTGSAQRPPGGAGGATYQNPAKAPGISLPPRPLETGPSLPANATPSALPPPIADTNSEAGRGRGSWKRPLAWMFAAGAVAVAGGSVAALVVSNSKAAEYNNLVDSTECRGQNAATCADLHDQGDRARTLAIVGFSLAGALAVGSTILFLTERGAPAPTATALRTCGVDWAARAVSCGVSF